MKTELVLRQDWRDVCVCVCGGSDAGGSWETSREIRRKGVWSSGGREGQGLGCRGARRRRLRRYAVRKTEGFGDQGDQSGVLLMLCNERE